MIVVRITEENFVFGVLIICESNLLFSLVFSSPPPPGPPQNRARFSNAPIASIRQGNNRDTYLVAWLCQSHFMLTHRGHSSTLLRPRACRHDEPHGLNLEEYRSGWTS